MIFKTPPSPEQVAKIRAGLNLSAAEFGNLLGFKDAARAVRALEHGEWSGKPYRLSGAALKALSYAMAMKKIIDARNSGGSTDAPIDSAAALIPKRMLS